MVSEEKHGDRGYVPVVVSVMEPALHLVCCCGRHLVEADDLGDDTLLHAVVSQSVCRLLEALIVRDNNDIFCTIGIVPDPFLHPFFIVNDR